MKIFHLLIIGSFLALTLACDVEKPKKDSEFQYEFKDEKCTTDLHKFENKLEYCEALKDEGLNRNCLKSHRELTFRQRCPGKWDDDAELQSESMPDNGPYGYELRFGSCTTGYHEFSTKEGYCLHLLDDLNNRQCAESLRLMLFEKNCRYVEPKENDPSLSY